MSPTARKIAAALLLLLGVQLWLIVGRGQHGTFPPLAIVLIVAAVSALPPVSRAVAAGIDRTRHPSPRARAVTTAVVFAAATSYLIFTGFRQQRDLTPKYHDEYMHLLQMRMLSEGKLWTRAHVAADSFESFHILVEPVYASIYFPGTSLLYVPAVWLALPYWLLPVLAAGACVALLYRVTTELIDGTSGLAAAMLLVSLKQFRFMSLLVMSHGVMLLAALAMLYAWLRWRASPTLKWAAAIGAVVGWAAITRPVDAICCAVPIVVAMLWKMRRQPPRRTLATVAVIAAAATPFLALQVIFNVGVTGDALQSPVAHYYRLYTPHMGLGFPRFDPSVRPATTLAQRVAFYDTLVAPAAAEHRADLVGETLVGEILPAVAEFALPSALLLIVLPPALLALRGGGGGRWVPPAMLPLFLAAYAMLPFFLPHYVLPISAAVIFTVVLGWHALQESCGRRLRPWVVTCFASLLALTTLRALPEFNRLVLDDDRVMPIIDFNQRIAEMVQTPALVLYRYTPGGNPHSEPVYNVDVTWPDDAPVIRAHDRTAEQNRTLFSYYARRRPNRKVYLVDRASVERDPDYRPEYLGTVSELAASPAPARPASSSPAPSPHQP